MANNETARVRRHSTRKSRPQTTCTITQQRESFSSPSSPITSENVRSNPSRGRQLWHLAVEGVLERERTPVTPTSTLTPPPTAAINEPIGWYNLTKRVMQLNASPLLANAAAPAVHKENWQQRRYNFLSKYSMFGGELKDEVADQIGVSEQGTDLEQKPIIPGSQTSSVSHIDSEALNTKRESIFGMAMTGVRNLLSADETVRTKTVRASTSIEEHENEENDRDHSTNVSVKGVHEDLKPETDDEVDHEITTDNEIVPTTTVVVPPLQPSIENRYSPSTKKSTKQNQKKLVEIQESYRSHRPYFTYWITFVQILVCSVSLLVYGYAPMTSNLSINASFYEHQRTDLTTNIWFGPYPSDLIRLGAKYTPCIRTHDEVINRYEKQVRLEALSGCCIDSTTERCMQTLPQQCLPRSHLSWHRTPLRKRNSTSRNNVVYPAVCGLTPETCTKKLIDNVRQEDDLSWSSIEVNSEVWKWSPTAAKWPICLEQDMSRIANNISLYPHMKCTNIARPCCTGILGDCVLTSKDDCRRRRGIYHPHAHLCSQVDCIQSVCGMLEFFVARLPDQVYRFWTVIFIHAGLIHLLITIIFHYTIMRPLEKLAGCVRVMIIYIVSGFVGSLASALFLRDSIQVGPGGGQAAILACYLSELFLGWRSLKRPWIPFFKIVICVFSLFSIGLLPLLDNYSQCFGFVIGFMLNMIVFPDVNYKKNIRHLVVVTASLASTIVLFIVLITLFYTVPFKCATCNVFNCPFGEICSNEKMN